MSFPASLRELQHVSPQQWLDRASRTVPQLLSVVLVIAVAWQLVQLTWLLLDAFSEPQAAEPIAPYTPAPAATRKGVDIQSIVGARMFGVPEAEAPRDSVDAPPSTANLVLSAVFAAEDPAKGLAIIGESAQSAKVYLVGGAVRPGMKLHAVYPDKVILDRSGQLEALLLPKQSTAGLTINRGAPPPPANNRFTENLRRIAENNPTAFAEVVRPQPVFANGVQRGYRVYPGRNRQQFAKLGLQPGDLVLAINGTPLDDPQRGMEIFNTMGTSDRVSVTIERNGQSQELTLNTAQISLPDANTASPDTRQQRLRPGDSGFAPTPPVE